MTNASPVTVALGARTYDIHIGAGLLSRLRAYIPPALAGRAAFIVTDACVAAHWLAPVRAAWDGPCHEIILPPGEGAKNPDTLLFVLSWMLSHGADRDAVVLALGGGVIGDLAGMAAALVLRGLPYIQIPTTLLAQVDSAVGGKTAVNMPQGKNMIGAFHQPAAVISDSATLATLPDREIRAGYAEILKYALIRDESFFAWLEDNGDRVLTRDPAALAHAVTVSCRMKAAIVAADERDEGTRMLLNFGHTFAHGIEAASGYNGSVLHGEAVAAGMILATRLSQRMGLCTDADRVAAHIAARGLPGRLGPLLPPGGADAMMAAMKHDKKTRGGRMTFILTRGIGKAFVAPDASFTDAAALIAEEAAV